VLALLLAPVLLQMVAMAIDEGLYHRRRGLPRWERLGHPVDTASVLLCYGWLISTRPDQPNALAVYVAMAALSCLLVTKDEAVHAHRCQPGEHWLHALLFVLHPVVLGTVGLLWWWQRDLWLLPALLALTGGLLVYQIVYWSLLWRGPEPR